ncbi:MAG: lipopolysaccharide biosynthesis protein [Acidimicrobiales bacterium]
MRDTGWSLVGEVGRLATQIFVFVILTYVFAPTEYGALVGALGLLMFLQPYAGLGATHLLLQRVAGDGWTIERALGRGLTISLVGGALLTLAVTLLQPAVLPQVDRASLAILSGSELIAMGVLELVVFSAIAAERLRAMAMIRVGHGIARGVAALVLLLFVHTVELWMWAVAATVAAFVVAMIGLVGMAGQVPRLTGPSKSDVVEGVPLSLGFGVQMISASADSFLLVRLDQVFDAGIYGAANRVIGMTRLPARALLFGSSARLYAAGARSVREGRNMALRATMATTAITGVAAVVVLLAADLIVKILPDEYTDTSSALRWLALLAVISSASTFAGTMLTAARLHRYRVALISAAAVVNVVLNLILIPEHGWQGAVAATFVSSILHTAGVWATLEYFVRVERRGGLAAFVRPDDAQQKNR